MCAKFLEKNSISRFLAKKYPNSKKNWLNQSSDGGDIVDLKSALFPKNFLTAGKMKQIGLLANNLYALEVQDACKALRRKATVGYLVVQRESTLPLNKQRQKKSQTIVEEPQLVKRLQEVVEQPQLEKPREDRVEASIHAERSNRGEFRAKWAKGSHASIPPVVR